MSVRNNLKASYSDINMLIAQLVSGMTSSLRFEGCLFESLSEFEKLLVPFPKFRFLTTSFGPFVPLSDALLASPSIE
jgi:tubulin alpha